MKAAIIIFPGTNRENDMKYALDNAGISNNFVFYNQNELPDNTDIVILPGGFSYGDYLRTGAMAKTAPIMQNIIKFANNGGLVLGVCNGFQILCEAGLLDGVLMPNNIGRFICKNVDLSVENNNTRFTNKYQSGQVINIAIAHGDGNYFADDDTLMALEDNNQIAFRYKNNPNGSQNNIAGIFNKNGNILGMMPHPENNIDHHHGSTDGLALFLSLLS